MAQYRKLIAALVGLALLLLHRHSGVDLFAQEAVVVDIVLALLTTAGVYGVRNGEAA